MAKQLMKGCVAIAEAAVRAGCRFFAGYPITPQNEIPEYLSWRLPEVGGSFIQGESEVASINMVYGAATAGVRAMTSSSGPGISLKAEGISYLSSTKLPALIVNISRGGPGLGSIQPAQQDYFQATKALGHGGFKVMVFAPASVQEAVDLVYNSFDYAERDRNPVLVLMDGCLGAIMELVELPPMKEISYENSKKWSIRREPGEVRSAHALTPVYPEILLECENKNRAKQYKSWAENDVMVEEYMVEDAEYVIVAYGISARLAKQAIISLRENGHKIGLIRPITLNPFPVESLKALDAKKVKGIIDVELAIPAQMREDIEHAVSNSIPVYEYGRSGGILMDDDGVYAGIEKIIKEAEKNGSSI